MHLGEDDEFISKADILAQACAVAAEFTTLYFGPRVKACRCVGRPTHQSISQPHTSALCPSYIRQSVRIHLTTADGSRNVSQKSDGRSQMRVCSLGHPSTLAARLCSTAKCAAYRSKRGQKRRFGDVRYEPAFPQISDMPVCAPNSRNGPKPEVAAAFYSIRTLGPAPFGPLGVMGLRVGAKLERHGHDTDHLPFCPCARHRHTGVWPEYLRRARLFGVFQLVQRFVTAL
jgi:hypothetical protein